MQFTLTLNLSNQLTLSAFLFRGENRGGRIHLRRTVKPALKLASGASVCSVTSLLSVALLPGSTCCDFALHPRRACPLCGSPHWPPSSLSLLGHLTNQAVLGSPRVSGNLRLDLSSEHFLRTVSANLQNEDLSSEHFLKTRVPDVIRFYFQSMRSPVFFNLGSGL